MNSVEVGWTRARAYRFDHR